VSGGAHVGRLDVFDARTPRPLAQMVFETVHRLALSFGVNFDATIRQIPHPAVKPFDGRVSVDEVAKAYSLHTTTD
jgi:hypothetical protein